MIEREDIKKLADLCRLEVSEEEIDELRNDFEAILDYVSTIKEAVSQEPIPSVGEHYNVMREDVGPHERGRYREALLNQAPKHEGDHLSVKKIISQD
jgi:aspartyl-tRNA(Asn)/glutamyl-tRNA(Gln) amidotransferase subunit C